MGRGRRERFLRKLGSFAVALVVYATSMVPAALARGEATGRGIVVTSPPMELNPELSGVYLSDVNSDGASDVVQIRFDAVDVWFNRGGASFTERLITRGTPFAPDYANRIRISTGSGPTTAPTTPSLRSPVPRRRASRTARRRLCSRAARRAARLRTTRRAVASLRRIRTPTPPTAARVRRTRAGP